MGQANGRGTKSSENSVRKDHFGRKLLAAVSAVRPFWHCKFMSRWTLIAENWGEPIQVGRNDKAKETV